ncbi:hypothetical protein [Spirosoma validum]|uniref:Uncharacterized protein n=1 Tax=Spirosoma validum TaxID=2771355 RepID=A0A927B5S6_9BACT|nr:hypothetical protein [Spirosoma validum]MBD2755747.1 hypothetical protein [Spirosoma validum]
MNVPDNILDRIYDFLAEIGIKVVNRPIAQSTFLPGILIDRGTLAVDPGQLLYPGDILHEAGHIAVTPAAERYLLENDITAGHPEKQGDELAVLLWTYAACQHIGIPPEIVFHPDGYKGQSQWLLDTFADKIYIGLPLLVWMGMTKEATAEGGFPAMTTWLRQ